MSIFYKLEFIHQFLVVIVKLQDVLSWEIGNIRLET